MTRRVWNAVAHYRLTIVSTVLVVAVVFLLFQGEEQRRDDQEQNRVLAALVESLKIETKARTTESCEASADRTHATRLAFIGIFDALDAAGKATGVIPSPFVAQLRTIIDDQLPELSCPTDQGPIVIPQPTATTG